LNTELDNKWYALYTKPRAEKKAYIDLVKAGVETYLPLRKELKQWCDRKKWIEIPVINSYIFVKISANEFKQIVETNNIITFVSFHGNAAPIPDREIETMKRVVENSLSISVETGNLKKGKKITFESGPLKGISGEIINTKGEKKLYIRLKNAGFTLVVNLD